MFIVLLLGWVFVPIYMKAGVSPNWDGLGGTGRDWD